jgi:hypothetical protein
MSYLAMARRVLNEQTREAEKATKETKKVPLPVCVECGVAIVGPTAWWGGEPVHLPCGKAAWRRAWRGEALPADAPAAEH